MKNFKLILKIAIIGIIIFIINSFFYQICIVYGISMEPTLKDKDIVIMQKFNLSIQRNDIVVIKKNNKMIIKRIIGIPNDYINIDNYTYVNFKKIDDKYIENNGDNNEVYLNENEYYCLGDNRNNSIDSRFKDIGIINKNEIIGKIISTKIKL